TALMALAAATTFAGDNGTAERMKKDITFLASDVCEGRGIDTQGINKAADYIADQLKQAGLKPGGKNGTYFQPFTVDDGMSKVEDDNTFTLRGPLGQEIALKLGKDYQALPMSSGGMVSAPVVFAGYGVQAKSPDYDDFKGIDVAGKIVVVLRRVPRWDSEAAPFAADKEKFAGLEAKIATCKLNKAAAVILVNDRSEAAAGDKLSFLAGGGPSDLPVLQLRRNVFDMILTSSTGNRLVDVEMDIDRDLKPRSGPLPGWTASLKTKRLSYACKNIIGVLEGSGPLADETVVVGAHYDHLGFGGKGSKTKAIHPGADDNASGTTTVMELARRFGALKNRQGRRMVFMLFSGEERGLLGSRHYCNKEPLFPLENTVAMLNLDMVGRVDAKEPKLIVQGDDSGKGFKQLIDKLNSDVGFTLERRNTEFGRSDRASFYAKKIPVVFFFTGLHGQYHRPTDTADLVNFAGMAKVATLAEKLLAQFAGETQRPEYVQLALGGKGAKGGKGGAKL
ncbi:MAG TPA: M28 family peptidase, partial [Pirellulales bacterium]|nr:M28 family peptidase [Pirellulales bacterium]